VDRLAIFDLDNTLVDRASAFARWADGFARRHGLGPASSAWLIDTDADGFADRRLLFERARAHFGLELSVDELLAAYAEDYVNQFAPDPVVLDALGRLKAAGWRVAVATNGPTTQRRKIDNAGLASWLDAICVSDELGFAKPDRRIFEAACAAAGVSELERAWMIGDTAAADIKGAHEVGMRSLWLHRGRRWVEPDFAPDAAVGSIREAVGHLLANG
jgi:HAD superfamily hydrolase (TIGR01509 family)